MAISLKIPTYKEELIRKFAKKTGKTKTAVILEAVDAKLGLHKDRKIKSQIGKIQNSINKGQRQT